MGMGAAETPRRLQGPRGDGDNGCGFTVGMGAKNTGPRGDGVNNTRDTTVCVSRFTAALAHPLYGANVLLKIVRTAVCTTNEHVSGPFLLPCWPYPRRQKKYAGCWLCRWASVFTWIVGIVSIRALLFHSFIPIVKYVKIRIFSSSVLYVQYVQYFKHLCIFGPKGAIQIRYYYYYYNTYVTTMD